MKHKDIQIRLYVFFHRPLRSDPPVKLSAATTDLNYNNGIDQAEAKQSAEIIRSALWHSKDVVFGLPRSIIYTLLHNPKVCDGHPVNSLISSLFAQQLATKLYPAAIAGLNYRVSIGDRGLHLSFFGYSDRLPEFAKMVMN